ncbi:hypothetical protein KSX_80440 [Ktedonospora formicarum]|uniref:Uncharacterized protein n=2 Tax=Ktedonospora formicarum TaxID=2778364 RepID=A0A8J3I744_9CHLR|nr:hypothetical protein KSX_80440 [Ktedonospora formicarum]
MKTEKPLELKRRTAGSPPRLTRSVAILRVLILAAYLVIASIACNPSPIPPRILARMKEPGQP